MSELVLLPDVDVLVSQYLRSCSEMTSLLDQRVVTAMPSKAADRVWPLVRLTQFNSIDAVPNWLDGASVQVDVYAETKAQASLIGRTARMVLHAMPGAYDTGVVSGVTTAGWRYEPDPEIKNSKGNPLPRFLFDATVHAHPNQVTGS